MRLDDAISYYQGGNGSHYGGSAVHLIGTNPMLDILQCGLNLNALIKGQAPNPGGFYSVNHDRGLVVAGVERLVPACLLEATGFADQALRAPVGQTHIISVSSFFVRGYALYIGPSSFQSIPGIAGMAYLDYAAPTTALIASGTLTAGAVNVGLPIPNQPSLIGYQFECQALLGPPQGQSAPAASLSMTAIAVVVP